MDFFKNYAIVAMQSDNANFYACKIIKVTSGFDFKKTFFSTILTPSGPPGVSREAKLSTKFEFGSLVH